MLRVGFLEKAGGNDNEDFDYRIEEVGVRACRGDVRGDFFDRFSPRADCYPG
jgi:hypothetical protein